MGLGVPWFSGCPGLGVPWFGGPERCRAGLDGAVSPPHFGANVASTPPSSFFS